MSSRVPVDSNDEIGTLAESVNDLADTLKERAHILGAFGRIVEPEVRDRLLDGSLASGGERRHVTVLFLDLKGYTSMAERETPEETVKTLNAFFETMSDWVHQCGGFVDKFVGDAMLVCFGLFDPGESSAPLGPGDHADAAVKAAAGIRGRLQELNALRVADSRPELSVGIGVHTGEVVAGIVGARDRHEYTVIGDAVNIAARLQEACRARGVDVLVSQTVREALKTESRTSNLSALGSMNIRGRSGTLDVYTIPESV